MLQGSVSASDHRGSCTGSPSLPALHQKTTSFSHFIERTPHESAPAAPFSLTTCVPPFLPACHCFLGFYGWLPPLLFTLPPSTFTLAFKSFCLFCSTLPPCPPSDLSIIPTQTSTAFNGYCSDSAAFLKLKYVKIMHYSSSSAMKKTTLDSWKSLKQVELSPPLGIFFICFEKI